MLVMMVIDGYDVPEPGDAADGARNSGSLPVVDHVAELLAHVSTGDQSAFAALYDMLSGRVFGLIMRVLVNRSQCEEVLQDVFLEVWQQAGSFDRSRGSGRSWLLTLAHRRAVDRVRASVASSDRDVRAGLREMHTGQISVVEEVELRLEGSRVTAALQKLSETQRETIVLAYFGGYSHSEISALIGAPLGTVKTRMRDGLTRLRTVLEVTT